jgi:tetratricopeptide (TPR) repeat protein
MMSGRFHDALAAAEKIEHIIDAKLLATTSPNIADWVEAHIGSRAHVLIRFGRWNDILKLQLPSDRKLCCSTTAVYLYARGIALSALGRIEEAETAQQDFEAAHKLVPKTRLNSIPLKEYDVLNVASAMLAGELQYRKGDLDTAFATLREAARREDDLAYSDPPPWMQPVRHALGGLLPEQGRVEEAEMLSVKILVSRRIILGVRRSSTTSGVCMGYMRR